MAHPRMIVAPLLLTLVLIASLPSIESRRRARRARTPTPVPVPAPAPQSPVDCSCIAQFTVDAISSLVSLVLNALGECLPLCDGAGPTMAPTSMVDCTSCFFGQVALFNAPMIPQSCFT